MRKHLSLSLAAVFLLTPVMMALNVLPVYAANRTSYIDLTGQPATAPATVAVQPELAVSTADEFFFSYVASTTQFAATNTIRIQVPNVFTGLATCASSTTNADGDATPDGAVTIVGNEVVYTFTAATTTAITTGVEICFAATTPATPGNYAIAMVDTNDADTSASMIYVGDTNEVTVTATVPVTLSLTIKSPTTTANTNSCALGVLNPAAVNTCSYRLAIGTNNSSGANAQIIADDQLNTAGNTADINDVLDTAVTAGAEEHGVTVTAGTGFTVQGGFSPVNYNDVPTIADAELAETIVSSAGPIDDSVTANWSTVTHGASITSAQPGGSYNTEVHVRVFANT